MNKQTIKINGKNYQVRFGMKQNLILARMWKLNKLSAIGTKLAKLNFKDGVEPTIPQLEILSQLCFSGILACEKNVDIDEDDVLGFMMESPDEMAKLLELYADSQPKPEKPKNAQRDRKK